MQPDVDIGLIVKKTQMRVLAVFDTILEKKDLTEIDEKDLVEELFKRIESIKQASAEEHESQKEALIQSFSQEFAMAQLKK